MDGGNGRAIGDMAEEIAEGMMKNCSGGGGGLRSRKRMKNMKKHKKIVKLFRNLMIKVSYL